MEVVAKDSEDETEDMAALDLKKKNIVSPRNTRLGNTSFHQSPGQIGTSRNSAYITAFESFSNVGSTSKDKSTPRKETGFQKASLSRDLSNSSCARSPAKISSEAPANVPDAAEISEKFEQVVASAPGSTKNPIDGGLSSKSMKSSLPLRPERIEHKSGSPLSNVSKNGLLGGFNTPKKIDLYGTDSCGIRSPSKGSSKGQTIPRGSSRSPLLSHSPNPLIKSGSASKPMEMLVSRPSTDGSCRLAFDMSPNKGNSSSREDASGGFLIPSEEIQDGTGSGGVKTPLKGALLNLDEEGRSSSPSKKKMSLSRSGLKSTKLSSSPKILRGSGLDTKATDMLVSGSSVPASHQKANDDSTNATCCLREDVGAINMLSEREGDENGSAGIKTPLGGASVHMNEGQTSNTPSTKKLTFSRSNSKSTKLNRSRKTSMATKATEGLVSGSLAHGSHQSAVDKSPPTNITGLLREEIVPTSKEAPVISALREDKQECNGQTPKRSRGRPKKQSLPNLIVNELSLGRTKSATAGEETHPSDQPDMEPPFPSTSTGVEKSDVQADMNPSKVDLIATKSKKKTLARKTLGTKPSICKGKPTRNKGFLSSLLQSEFSGHSNRAVATEDTNNAPIAEVSVAVSPRTNEDIPVDDETEAPECEEPNNFDKGAKNFVAVEEPHSEKATPKRKEPSEKTTKTKKGANTKVKKNAEAKKSVCNQKPELPESKSTDAVAEKKISGNKKRPLAKTKINKSNNPTEEAKQDETKSISSNEGTLILAGKTSKRPSKKLKRSDDVEKENEPVTNEQHSVSCDKGAVAKSTSHRLKEPLNVSTDVHNMKIEPACFILSGHRLQRKEFQQVIKRLRGKVCRDSHSWSYQATHFIVPDPIRRTEKFFAAAASGRYS